MSTGGDGYSLFVGKKYVRTGLPLRELIVSTIRQQGVVMAKNEGRIRRMD
jgi:hypothetical protein